MTDKEKKEQEKKIYDLRLSLRKEERKLEGQNPRLDYCKGNIFLEKPLEEHSKKELLSIIEKSQGSCQASSYLRQKEEDCARLEQKLEDTENLLYKLIKNNRY